MGQWILQALLIVFVGCVVWVLLQPRYVFEIRVREGKPVVRKGKVTAAFLAEVAAVCRECSVSAGWVGGVMQGKRVALRFSRQFPPGAQQRLRNEWALAG
ncbi:MAG TPA: DUF3634 family protein [Gemmataceae bacterium]|jgi:hypothetical protein|nr:DUF3634 family protein [Gemmataceae bacterium]